jgi:iron complex outermembrane receptor protein
MRKYLLSLFFSIFAFCLAFAQVTNAQTRVTGKIVDADTKEPLVGASVLVKGTSKATSTVISAMFLRKPPYRALQVWAKLA